MSACFGGADESAPKLGRKKKSLTQVPADEVDEMVSFKLCRQLSKVQACVRGCVASMLGFGKVRGYLVLRETTLVVMV